MQTRSPYDLSVEPLPPDQRMREENQPAGLRNIGNTCYFNSLLQVYFSMPEFVNPDPIDFKGDANQLGQDVEMARAPKNSSGFWGRTQPRSWLTQGSNCWSTGVEEALLLQPCQWATRSTLDPSGVLRSDRWTAGGSTYDDRWWKRHSESSTTCFYQELGTHLIQKEKNRKNSKHNQMFKQRNK